MTKKRIGVLMGGIGPERDISLRSGEGVCDALREGGFDVQAIVVNEDFDQVLRDIDIDVAFIALHGPYAEDGTIQGLLELRGIPYTGSGVLGSALAMDKFKSKELFRLYNIATPGCYRVSDEDLENLENLHGSFGFPVFVKPARGGSSLASGIANSMTEMKTLVEVAMQVDDQVLVERYIRGREINIGIVDGQAIGGVEIVPNGEFYDFHSKYTDGGSEYFVPPRIEETRLQCLYRLAERAAQSVDARGACRVDLLVCDDANEYVIEVNTVPGMTSTSLLPKIAAHNGMSYTELCAQMVALARLDYPRAKTTKDRATGKIRRLGA